VTLLREVAVIQSLHYAAARRGSGVPERPIPKYRSTGGWISPPNG
jgi:hypothetical protein